MVVKSATASNVQHVRDLLRGRQMVLEPLDRDRLRPTVNWEALERFLSAISPGDRPFAILTFLRDVSIDDVRTVLEAAGAYEALHELEEVVNRPLLNPSAPADQRPSHIRIGGLPYLSVIYQNSNVVFRLVPTDPALLPLWRLIEPGFTDLHEDLQNDST